VICKNAASGCNYPEGECLGICLNKGLEVILKPGTKITCRETRADFFVAQSDATLTLYSGKSGKGECKTEHLAAEFVIDGEPAQAASVLDTQVDGDHYKKLGAYQPWEVLRRWLTPEEFRGYMKGTAIAYLAREQDKGGLVDIKKATHTLQGLAELMGAE